MGDGYFDDAPTQSEYGVNDDGSMFHNPADFAGDVAEKTLPGVKQVMAGDELLNQAPAVGRMFEGEATIDDFIAVADAAITFAVSMIEAGEQIMDVKDALTGDPWGLIGDAVSVGVSLQLNFILEAFQPAQDLFGMITGNPERIFTSQAMWETLATGLQPLGTELLEAADQLGEAWQDDGADAARVRLMEGNDVIQVAAGLSLSVADALEHCGNTFEKVQSYIINRISDVMGALVSYIPKVPKGPPGWAQIAADFIPMMARIILELTQIAMYLARAFYALVELMNGAEDAAERMTPYIDAMSSTG